MKRPSWKEKFQYWFDDHMAKGTGSMVWMLSVGTAVVIAAIAGVEILLHLGGESEPFSVLWDSMAYTVNAWIPFSEDGTAGHILLTALGGFAGLFFTSTLIGIISSSIEEKASALRKGNSLVLERDHIVVLGFKPGEYALIRQLVLAEVGKRVCIVIADAIERDEMERMIRENLSIPKGVRIICRNADICDPQSLSICSIPDSRAVVINVMDDNRTTKALLAVSALLERENAGWRDIPVISAVSSREALLPRFVLEKHGIITLQTHDLIARLIAHSCTQPGLSQAFLVIFDFDGSEMYLRTFPGTEGKTFAELTERLDGAVPVGLLRDGKTMLNPSPEQTVRADDQLFLFADDDSTGAMIPEDPEPGRYAVCKNAVPGPNAGRVVIFGCNDVLEVLLRELPPEIQEVEIADVSETNRPLLDALSAAAADGRKVTVAYGGIASLEELERLARRADYVVLLSDHDTDAEQADLHSIRLLLCLREIKSRAGLPFTITAEMQRESNHNLVMAGDPTDFIVASDIVSNILAQLARDPRLYPVFQELLSNEGNELYLKTAAALGCAGKEYTVRQLRQITLTEGYVLLGYLLHREDGRSVCLNPPLGQKVTLSPTDSLIVLGEN